MKRGWARAAELLILSPGSSARHCTSRSWGRRLHNGTAGWWSGHYSLSKHFAQRQQTPAAVIMALFRVIFLAPVTVMNDTRIVLNQICSKIILYTICGCALVIYEIMLQLLWIQTLVQCGTLMSVK